MLRSSLALTCLAAIIQFSKRVGLFRLLMTFLSFFFTQVLDSLRDAIGHVFLKIFIR
jgi:hypothetical protein